MQRGERAEKSFRSTGVRQQPDWTSNWFVRAVNWCAVGTWCWSVVISLGGDLTFLCGTDQTHFYNSLLSEWVQGQRVQDDDIQTRINSACSRRELQQLHCMIPFSSFEPYLWIEGLGSNNPNVILQISNFAPSRRDCLSATQHKPTAHTVQCSLTCSISMFTWFTGHVRCHMQFHQQPGCPDTTQTSNKQPAVVWWICMMWLQLGLNFQIYSYLSVWKSLTGPYTVEKVGGKLQSEYLHISILWEK